MTQLRSNGIYRLPSGVEVVAVKTEDDKYFLYLHNKPIEGLPQFEVTPDGQITPWIAPGSGWQVKDLIDTGMTYD